MCKVKSEQYFAAPSAKRVAVFQGSLKLVREEAGAQISKKKDKFSTSQESNHLHERGHCKLKSFINLEIVG